MAFTPTVGPFGVGGTLGEPVFHVPEAPPPPLYMLSIPGLPARTPHDDLVDRLETIIDLLEGLRHDAYRRSLEGRCRRLWTWIRSLGR